MQFPAGVFHHAPRQVPPFFMVVMVEVFVSKISAQLQSAKGSKKKFVDVDVLLDGGASGRLQELGARLDAAKADGGGRLSAPNPLVQELAEQIEAEQAAAAGGVATLRFTRMAGNDWSAITARCPVRLDAPIDAQYGYNMQKACEMAAPLCGVSVEDGVEVPLTVTKATETEPAVDEWADLFATISGHEFGKIMDAIYGLNEYDPVISLAEAKKALAGRPA